MPETHFTFCRICEALCGLEITTDGGRITRIRPDRQHVATRGYACPKGLAQEALYGSPDRLLRPQKRVGRRFVEIPWAQALAEIGAKVRALRATHGADAIASYAGTAAGFSVLHPIFVQGFLAGLGSRSQFSSASQDCSNKFAVAREMYGFPFLQPFPDVDHTTCLVVVGANPAISKMSFLHLPRPMARLRAIEARGGRVFWIDPRRTESAAQCGEHLFIRPGTDVFFFLSFLHTLVEDGGVDRARADRVLAGRREVEALAAAWSPERTAPLTGIAPEALRSVVTAFRTAPGAALYCSTGVNMGPQGALAFWLQECINALSGNLDRRGGTLVGKGLVDFPSLGRRTGVMASRHRSRVGGFGVVADCLPGGILADEILTPGPGQVRALFVSGGNPLLTFPNGARLARAFEQLDLLVSIDIFRNETGELAHYLLPATGPLERPDLLFVFPLLMGQQSRPYLQATEAVVPPPGEAREEREIYLDLAAACGAPIHGSRLAQAILGGGRRLAGSPLGGLAPTSRALLSLLLRLGGAGSFDALLAHPHGRPLPPPAPGTLLGQRVVTPDGRVQLAPPPFLAAAAHLEALEAAERATLPSSPPGAPTAAPGPDAPATFRLITRRAVRTHNSWTHNVPGFVAGDRGTNHLDVHPADADRLGLADGDLADVRSATGRVRVGVRLCPELLPGVVALGHGWGHQAASGLRVASRTSGVNVNLLAADGPEALERLAGMAQLTALLVHVAPAAGPRDPTHWSGLPPTERGDSVLPGRPDFC